MHLEPSSPSCRDASYERLLQLASEGDLHAAQRLLRQARRRRDPVGTALAERACVLHGLRSLDLGALRLVPGGIVGLGTVLDACPCDDGLVTAGSHGLFHFVRDGAAARLAAILDASPMRAVVALGEAFVAALGDDARLALWQRAEDGAWRRRHLEALEMRLVERLLVASDGRRLLAVHESGWLVVEVPGGRASDDEPLGTHGLPVPPPGVPVALGDVGAGLIAVRREGVLALVDARSGAHQHTIDLAAQRAPWRAGAPLHVHATDAVALSPDGRQLAWAMGAEVVLWSLEAPQVAQRVLEPECELDVVHELHFEPGGSLLAVYRRGNRWRDGRWCLPATPLCLRRWRVADGALMARHELGWPAGAPCAPQATRARLSATRRTLALCDRHYGQAALLDLRETRAPLDLPGFVPGNQTFHGALVSPDGRRALVHGAALDPLHDELLATRVLWDVELSAPRCRLATRAGSPPPRGEVWCDERRLVVDDGGELVVLDALDARELRRLRPLRHAAVREALGARREARVTALAGHAGADRVAACLRERQRDELHAASALVLCELESGDWLSVTPLAPGSITALRFASRSGRLLLLERAGHREPFVLLDLSDPFLPRRRAVPRADVLAISPDGELLAGAATQGVGLWSGAEAHYEGTLQTALRVNHVAFDPSGRWLAARQGRARIGVWHLESRSALLQADGHQLAWHPHLPLLLVVDEVDALLVDVERGRVVETFPGLGATLGTRAIRFTSDGLGVIAARLGRCRVVRFG